MKAERDALNASRRAEAADARKALADIDYLQVRNWKQRLFHAPVPKSRLGNCAGQCCQNPYGLVVLIYQIAVLDWEPCRRSWRMHRRRCSQGTLAARPRLCETPAARCGTAAMPVIKQALIKHE